MSSVLVEKITEDIEKHLEDYQGLLASRFELQERLKRARDEKGTVKESIFEKVCEEYTTQIDKLEKSIEPLRQKVEKIRRDIAALHATPGPGNSTPGSRKR